MEGVVGSVGERVEVEFKNWSDVFAVPTAGDRGWSLSPE